MKALCLLLLIMAFDARCAKLTLTFDDAPRGNGWKFTGDQRTEALLAKFRKKKVPPVVFYANPGWNQSRMHRLKKYSDAGHFIGNHTFKHKGLDKSSSKEFTASIKDAENHLKKYKTFKKWFRYPMLREGKSDIKKGAEVKKYLEKNGYRHGYVTVEIYDWHINSLVKKAYKKGKKVNLNKVKDLYIGVLLDSIKFYDELALKTIKRSPVHVVLLHENDINALFLEEIIDAFKKAGHEIVSAEKAFDDPVSNDKWNDHHYSQRRISSIAELKGHKGELKPKWTSREVIKEEFNKL